MRAGPCLRPPAWPCQASPARLGPAPVDPGPPPAFPSRAPLALSGAHGCRAPLGATTSYAGFGAVCGRPRWLPPGQPQVNPGLDIASESGCQGILSTRERHVDGYDWWRFRPGHRRDANTSPPRERHRTSGAVTHRGGCPPQSQRRPKKKQKRMAASSLRAARLKIEAGSQCDGAGSCPARPSLRRVGPAWCVSCRGVVCEDSALQFYLRDALTPPPPWRDCWLKARQV